MRFALSVIVLLTGLYVRAQSCSIISDSIVCSGELIQFTASVTPVASSYSWDFDDGTSANQKVTSHTYATPGVYEVTLITTFPGGVTCTTSTKIRVHDLPTAFFGLNDTATCFDFQQLCLYDQSGMGQTTSGYSYRSILWGDGSLFIDSTPARGDTLCYSDYPRPGKYTITVEVQNDKGCEDKWSTQIRVLPSFQPSFSFSRVSTECDSVQFCFNNDSSMIQDILRFEWDFGNGTTDTTNWASRCLYYTESGEYTVSLKVWLTNGCVLSVSRTVNVNFVSLELDAQIKDSVLCYPDYFEANTPKQAGVTYYWELYDSNYRVMDLVSKQNYASVIVPSLGDYYLKVKAVIGKCVDESRYFTLRSVGSIPRIMPLNNTQCVKSDTVYFINQSVLHPELEYDFIWTFDDPMAPSCSTWRNNCNHDTAFNSRHWYEGKGCFQAVLEVRDRTYGCVDTTSSNVSIEDSITDKIDVILDRACIGERIEYEVKFDARYCVASIDVNYDSASNKWEPMNPRHIYDTVYDSDGWVTPQFAVTTGSNIVYHSPDTSDYTRENRAICRDTFTKTKWFRLEKEPDFELVAIKDSCEPKARIELVGDDPGKITLLGTSLDSIQWDYQLIKDGNIPDIDASFDKMGRYKVYVHIVDSIGCYEWTSTRLNVGYDAKLFVDTIICANTELTFLDTVRYFNDTSLYWADSNSVEEILWDFDDGAGFSISGSSPTHLFRTRGVYQVKMLTVDSVGCSDTLVQTIYVGGVVADVIKGDTSFGCNEILSFLDSSYFDFTIEQEYISEYYWDFGDNSTPSYLKNPFHNYTSYGRHKITHAVKANTGCSDTISYFIEINGPQPLFDIISDSIGCVPFTVTLASNSINVSKFIWYMGDSIGNTIAAQSDTVFSYTYDKPGTYYIALEGIDSFYNKFLNNYYSCKAIFPDENADSSDLKWVKVLPYPKVAINARDTVCVGEQWKAVSASDSLYNHFAWYLDGIRDSGDNKEFEHVFNDTGTYVLWLKPSYDLMTSEDRACYDSSSIELKVYDVEADFSFEYDGCFTYEFTNTSTNAHKFYWDLDVGASGDHFSEDEHPVYTYPRFAKKYLVRLDVTSPEGCVDRTEKEVSIEHTTGLSLYNVFTPNNDGVNDLFVFDVVGAVDYDLRIYNRYGELVFNSQTTTEGWNGQQFNNGQSLPEGTYFYVLTIRMLCEDEQVIEGSVDLIR